MGMNLDISDSMITAAVAALPAVHPAASVFPLLPCAELAALAKVDRKVAREQIAVRAAPVLTAKRERGELSAAEAGRAVRERWKASRSPAGATKPKTSANRSFPKTHGEQAGSSLRGFLAS